VALVSQLVKLNPNALKSGIPRTNSKRVSDFTAQLRVVILSFSTYPYELASLAVMLWTRNPVPISAE
jgi:hypothetical protein